MNYLLPERLDKLAREYAVGTLQGGALRRFERVLNQSHDARRAVGRWQERLATLASAAPAMQPGAQVWSSIEQRLFAPRAAPALPAAAAAPGRSSGGGWAWLGAIFSGRSLGGALAGALLAVLVLSQKPALISSEPLRDTLPPSYVGLLSDAQSRPTVLASSRRHGRQLTVKLLQPLAVPAGSVAQLWALPREGAPFPVGTVPASGSASITLPDTSERLFSNVSRLAVTIEAAPAGPGSTPSADGIAAGPCVKLW